MTSPGPTPCGVEQGTKCSVCPDLRELQEEGPLVGVVAILTGGLCGRAGGGGRAGSAYRTEGGIGRWDGCGADYRATLTDAAGCWEHSVCSTRMEEEEASGGEDWKGFTGFVHKGMRDPFLVSGGNRTRDLPSIKLLLQPLSH